MHAVSALQKLDVTAHDSSSKVGELLTRLVRRQHKREAAAARAGGPPVEAVVAAGGGINLDDVTVRTNGVTMSITVRIIAVLVTVTRTPPNAAEDEVLGGDGKSYCKRDAGPVPYSKMYVFAFAIIRIPVTVIPCEASCNCILGLLCVRRKFEGSAKGIRVSYDASKLFAGFKGVFSLSTLKSIRHLPPHFDSIICLDTGACIDAAETAGAASR